MKVRINRKARTHELTIPIHDLNWDEMPQAPFYEGAVQERDLLQLIGHE
jgi:hypothetical protein